MMTHSLLQPRKILTIFLSGILYIPLPSLALDLPIPDFTATYKVAKGSLTFAETTRSLTTSTGGLYAFKSITRPVGLGRLFTSGEITEASEWRYQNGATVPVTYSYLDSSKKKARNVQLGFDWETLHVTNTINGDPWKMELTPTTQDKLLYQLQLMIDLASGKASGKNNLKYDIADGGLLKEYLLEILGPETIKSKLGEFNTIRVRRTTDSRETTFWCAKELHYLPVRIEHRKKKSTPITATLLSVTGLP